VLLLLLEEDEEKEKEEEEEEEEEEDRLGSAFSTNRRSMPFLSLFRMLQKTHGALATRPRSC
jgi:hypothetical protein